MSMLKVFGKLKSLLKESSINTDNGIFRLHYKTTKLVLIACCLLVSQKQYFGDPIDCDVGDVDSKIIRDKIIDTYCWISSTYTLSHSQKDEDKEAHPGVRQDDDGPQRHHKYYQWVFIVLALQAIMFYIPHYLWKAWEGGKIKMLAADLNAPIVDDEKKRERKEMLTKYFYNNLNNHNIYAIKFFICEMLNFINVIGQMYFINRFLGGEFFQYGINVLNFSESDAYNRHDPMDLVFPKVAKCTFNLYGSSGSKQNYDGLCVLPLNILNEKIYIFLWFWFIILAVVTAIALVHRLVTIISRGYSTFLLKMRSPLTISSDIQDVALKCKIGDWFLLYQLAKNIDPLIYKAFMHDLAMRMRGNGPM